MNSPSAISSEMSSVARSVLPGYVFTRSEMHDVAHRMVDPHMLVR